MLHPRLITLIGAAIMTAGALTGCKTMTSVRLVLPNAPISYQLVSEMVDEETIENTIKFRNMGQEVVSFDYTVADEPSVPHVDSLGPNSGLVENLYPGAETKVKNPIKGRRAVFVTLGRVTYGKRTAEELAKTYKPGTLTPAAPASGGASPLPLLEPVNVPGQ